MVKVLNYTLNGDIVNLFADSKEDITSEMEVQGLPDGTTIGFGSSARTANGEIAYLKSNGEWNWIGESDE